MSLTRTTHYTMPTKLTKSHQQDIVADFVYAKGLEHCMYIYLDAFVDRYRRLYPQKDNMYGTRGIKALLEASYQGIRDGLERDGLLTTEASAEYMMTLSK